MNTLRLAVASLVLASTAAAAPRPLAHAVAAPVGHEVVAAPLLAPTSLPIVVRCEACQDQGPSIGLLWRTSDTSAPLPSRNLAARDWNAGGFVLSGPDGETNIQGERVAGGWAVEVPLGDLGSPFRVVAALDGFVAAKAVYWPQQQPAGALVFEMQRLDSVLDQHPTWDPARTSECAVLLPKAAEIPAIFTADGQPVAWLFPTPGSTDPETAWTFQFVRPGASTMERVSVRMPATDEGDSWGFRVPLEGIAAPRAARALPSDAVAHAPLAEGRQVPEAARVLSVPGVGIIDLADCPRVAR